MTKRRGLDVLSVNKRLMPLVIDGTAPLLMDAVPWWSVEDIKRGHYGLAKLKRDFTEDEEFEASIYYDEAKRICFPGGGIRSCCVSAGRSIKGVPMTDIKQAIQIPARWVYFEEDPTPVKFESLVGKGSKKFSMRAMIDLPWALEIPFLFIPSEKTTSFDQALSILQLAGSVVGLGAWRPECGGTYGTFTIRMSQEVLDAAEDDGREPDEEDEEESEE